MKVILCMLVDKNGHLKYATNNFKPNEADICVSNFVIGDIGKKSIYYTLLDYDEKLATDTCWTVSETLRRCEEYVGEKGVVKIFTRIEDFLKNADEILFAYVDSLDEYDETLDMKNLSSFCKDMQKNSLGEIKGVKFFKYNKINGGM